MDATKILSRRELAAVLADLAKRSVRSRQSRLNRVIFRLACCCGLRATEIARLQLADVHTSESRPDLVVRPKNGKTASIAGLVATHPAKLVAFDMLYDRSRFVMDEPLHSRRSRLQDLVARAGQPTFAFSETMRLCSPLNCY